MDCVSKGETDTCPIYITLVATEVFLAGAFFLVTPTGLLALVVALPFFGPLLAPVFAVARFLVVVVVSGTVGNTRGREFPICSLQQSSTNITRPAVGAAVMVIM
jgi:membrane protein implicated in regulation of membrane protease activity